METFKELFLIDTKETVDKKNSVFKIVAKKEDIKEERGSCDELVFESIGDHSIRISIDLEGTIRIYTSDPSVSFLVDRRDLSTKTITLRKNLTNPTQ